MIGSPIGHFGPGMPVTIVRNGMVPDGQVIVIRNLTGPPDLTIGIYEPHAIAKRIVRDGLADVLAWLTPERRPNMATGQEILDRLKGDRS